MPPIYVFREFTLDLTKRRLSRRGELVELHPRALDTLVALVRRAGQVVSKQELMDEVWQDVVVEENNASQQISALRRILGDDRNGRRFIETIPRKGYCFVAEVREATEETGPVPRRFLRSRTGAAIVAAAMLLVFIAVLLATTRPSTATAAKGVTALALLPIAGSAEDDALEHFLHGLTEELDGRLRRDGSLQVVRPGGGHGTPLETGRSLNVDAVLTGRMLRRGTAIELELRLHDIRSETRLWRGNYVSDPEDLPLLSASVERDLRQELGLEPAKTEAGRISPPFEAYEAYLRGRYHLSRRTHSDFRKAVEHFSKAIDIESHYAEARAGLAMALGFQGREEEARLEAARALALDPELAELRAYLALVHLYYDPSPELARREFERAVAIDPRSAVVRHWYAFYLSYTAQHESAIEQIRLAHEMDPLSLIIGTDVGVILIYAGRYQEAIEELERVRDLDPTFINAGYYRAIAYEQVGEYQKAEDEWNQIVHDPLARVPTLIRMGRVNEADQIVSRELPEVLLSPRHGIRGVALSQAYAALGDLDNAFHWLERALEVREGKVMTLLVHPRFEPLRSDVRYEEMLRNLQLARS